MRWPCHRRWWRWLHWLPAALIVHFAKDFGGFSAPGGEGQKRLVDLGVPTSEAAGVAALAEAVAAEGPEPLADPLTLLRFYRARGRDVEAAAGMYNATLAWRSSFSIPLVMDAYGEPGHYKPDSGRATDPATWTWVCAPRTPQSQLAMRHAFFGRICTHMADEPILVWRAGSADYKGIVREDMVDLMIQAFVVHLEDALQASRAASLRKGELVRARLIIDCDGFGFDNARYIPILRRIISLGKSYFPEVTASVTVVRAPAFLATFYGLIRPFLPKLLQDKVCILGKNFASGLQKHTGLDVAMLPLFLGGSSTEIGMAEALPVPSDAWSSASSS